jgi:ParB family transcriptional regulator, chromosome partitioning protein
MTLGAPPTPGESGAVGIALVLLAIFSEDARRSRAIPLALPHARTSLSSLYGLPPLYPSCGPFCAERFRRARRRGALLLIERDVARIPPRKERPYLVPYGGFHGMDKKHLGGGNTAVAEAPTEAEVLLTKIQHNPHQPRKSFDADELASLSASVKTHGILQPLVVRLAGDGYQLIAGERRLRAAQEAGLTSVPVHVVDFNDQQVLEAALAENIQRSDLNPIEKAQGFKDYLERFGMHHDQLAQRLGLARSSITNLVNLLEMAPEVQEGVRLGQISEAHAKLLKGVKNKDRQIALFKQIVAMGLSVKATEGLVREQKEAPAEPPRAGAPAPAPGAPDKTTHVKGLEDELRKKLATPVEIKLRSKDKGQIVVRFESNDDFMRILAVLRK